MPTQQIHSPEQITPVREILTGNRTYYVRTDGSDTNNGLANTSGGAFLTIQKAINTVASIDLSIYDVTIQIGDGTYTGAITVTGPWVGSGTVTLQGNSGTPANVFISVTSATAITVQDGARITLKDFKVGTTTSGFALLAQRNANVILSGLNFAACASQQMRSSDSSAISVSGNYTISGGGATHWMCVGASVIRCQSVTITLSGTPAFTTFATCINLGMMFVDGITFSGSATGARYSATGNGVINTGGGGATYLPGDSAGSTTSGGQYI